MANPTPHAGTRLRDFPLRPPVVVPPDATVQEAARTMRDQNVGAVVVGSPGQPISILTERDVTAVCAERDVATVRAGDAAVERPLVVGSDDTIFDAAVLMLRWGVRHLIVITGHHAVGVISIRDALDAVLNSPDPDVALTALRHLARPRHE